MLAALLSSETADPIQTAMDYYQGIDAYQTTMKSVNGDNTEIIQYYFKKPGQVRMEFVTPIKGAVLIYDSAAKKAKLWPFGYRRFPAFNLSPDNSIIQSSSGQRVDRSDVGVLYQNVKTLQEKGNTEILGTEDIDGRETLHMMVTGENHFAVNSVARYQLWLDLSNGFPHKVIAYDKNGQVIETVQMNKLIINPKFPAGFFTQ